MKTFENRAQKSETNKATECYYVGVLISFWLFLFAAQPKEFFLDVLKKL
jgi:hypothetical protein